MPSNRKKSKSKQTKPKRAVTKPSKKATRAKQAVKRRPPDRVAKKKRASKKTSSKANARERITSPGRVKTSESSRGREDTLSGRLSGDLQGLSRTEQADSESVNELVEEGNLFEAGAVAGVEEADNADESEVHTHEVPEDDVPDEYLDKD
jgi:hypothetical protein